MFPSNVTDAPPSGNFLVVVRIEDNVGQKVTDGVYTWLAAALVRLDGAGPNAVDDDAATPARGILTNTITSTVTIAGLISDTGGSGLDELEVAFAPISQVVPSPNSALQLQL